MSHSVRYLLRDRDATRRLGRALGALLRPHDVLALVGDLGAGKTWLTRAIAEGLAVEDDVTSPTFTLVHEYRGSIPMVHMDPYRLTNPEDLLDIGLDDYLQRPAVVVLEWADRLGALLPATRLTLTLEIQGDEEGSMRLLTAVATGARYQALLNALRRCDELSDLAEPDEAV